MNNSMPELLSPAGSWSALRSAADAGCDAVYFGLGNFNMRAWASNFDILELDKVMSFLRDKGLKGYLTLNVLFHQEELGKLEKALDAAKDSGVDAVIAWDMAALALARERSLPVHLSTQASVSNFESFKFYASFGVKRIVLARECSLKDIKRIKKLSEGEEDLDCEIECFVHGAMCSSLSGRCYLSQEVFGKSANRGECVQPCRRKYKVTDIDGECEFLLGEDYVLSAKDLCAISFLDELIDSGIDAFKIEGRMRSPEYVGVVTEVYRKAMDSCLKGDFTPRKKESFFEKLKSSAFSRGFSEGFYRGRCGDMGEGDLAAYQKVFLGEVRKFYKKISVAEVEVMNEEVAPGNKILIYGKNTPASFAVVESIEKEHKALKKARRGEKVGIKLPFSAHKNDKVFLWREKKDE